MKSFKDVKVK